MTIVRELVLQVARGAIPGVPSAHVIRIDPSGQLFVEGPVAAGGRGVSRAAQLLESLLPPFEAPPEFKVRGALRLTLARALGTLDVPQYESLEAFAEALDRFAAADPRQTIRDLAQSVGQRLTSPSTTAPANVTPEPGDAPRAQESERREAAGRGAEDTRRATADTLAVEPQLTISDIRRARRSSGLPLAEISARSRIPVLLLRQLEWGYLRNWPTGLYGRTQLVRYARAAGLEEKLVVATAWPMLEEVERERQTQPVSVESVVIESAPAEIGEISLERAQQPALPPRRRARAVVWVAAAAALLIALVPLLRHHLERTRPGIAETIARNLDGVAPAAPAVSTARPSQPAKPVGTPATAPGTENPTVPRSGSSIGEASPALNSRDVAGARRTGPDARGPDAAPARGLTDDAVAYSPTFASVGSAMFDQAEGRGASALMRADTNQEGSILRITRVVDDHARNYHARPSPDGTRIAFDSDREGERAVYIANADGTNVRRVSGEGFASVPSWSPDGRELAFVRAEPERPKVWNLWLLDLKSGEMRRLTSHTMGQPWGGSWFPDGRRIAYSHEDRLVILDLESGGERVFRSPRKGQLVRTPAVSPDGRLIMFQVYRDGAWLLDVSDGSMRKILADPSAEEYTWSPDGRRVAYHSRRTGSWGVWLMATR